MRDASMLPIITLWHLAGDDGLTLNNAWLGKGWMASASFTAAMPGLQGVGTMYGLMRGNDPKEQAWEEVRRAVAPMKPSRRSAFFAFVSRDDAERARSEWFQGQDRELLRVELHPGHAMFRIADARWLDCEHSRWPSAAHHYWVGDMTDDPRREVICHGRLFFPDWEAPPFGLLTSRR